jgi:hypothetical protein
LHPPIDLQPYLADLIRRTILPINSLTVRKRLAAGGRWIRTIGTPEREACFFGTLKFNGGILFGLTPAVPRQTLRWQLEYEVHF